MNSICQLYLVGGVEHLFFHSVGNVIAPTDYCSFFFFFRGVQTTNQIFWCSPEITSEHPADSRSFWQKKVARTGHDTGEMDGAHVAPATRIAKLAQLNCWVYCRYIMIYRSSWLGKTMPCPHRIADWQLGCTCQVYLWCSAGVVSMD